MKRTKIVCTIGPASSSHKILKELAEAGMDVVRLNFSHGTHKEHLEVIRNIRRISAEINKPIGILQDLAGPKIRIGSIKKGTVLKEGFVFTLTTKEIEGDENTASIPYQQLIKEINTGDPIFIDDGRIKLKVIRHDMGKVVCQVVRGGELKSHKGVNFPQTKLSIPSLTPKDIEDLNFGIEEGVDLIGLSFVRCVEDIKGLQKLLKERRIPIIAKIEKKEAVENISEILKVADGIMVARGDLGVETSLAKVPLVQKGAILEANLFGKPVITATQMLESMVEEDIPTRAEVTDIANAIFDSTDALMLSAETAIGKYPVQCVKTMVEIALEAEQALEYEAILKDKIELRRLNTTEAIGFATAQMAMDLGVSAIITCTQSGMTARMIAKYRPSVPIIAVSPSIDTVRQLTLSWGVYPVKSEQFDNTDDMIGKAIETAKSTGIFRSGDKVIITGGVPVGVPNTTNFLQVVVV
ncbi:MAG: pyruvate kinase [Nitrospirota bacterium]